MKHMSNEGFTQMMRASEMLADVLETGSRQKSISSINHIMDWIEANKSKFERCKKSRYCIYTASVNIGTRKFPYYVTILNTADVTATVDGFPEWRETEQYYISRKGERVRKDKIVGWLT